MSELTATGAPEAVAAYPGPVDDRGVARVGGWDRNDTPYLNRELSWLAFDARVLQLAADHDVPLLERVFFCAIFATNLDEFFQVRVAGLHDQLAAGIGERTPDGRSPADQLRAIHAVTRELVARHEAVFIDEIRPALARAGIELATWDELTDEEREWLAGRFEARIFPVLTPLAVDPGHPFPYISDLSLNLAVVVRDPGTAVRRFARVKVPNTLDRWVRIGDSERFVPLEEVIGRHLDRLFPGMEILEWYRFRVTRNADLTLEEEEAEDLLSAVEMELRRRRFGKAVRLEIEDGVSDEVLELLVRELDLSPDDVYRLRAPLDASGLQVIAALDRPDLHWPPWTGITEPELVAEDEPADLFAVLRRRDVLVHHPYSSFATSVVEFVHQAAVDPAVLAIKLTLYRTSGDSPIIDALITAAERGKQVAVLVELKARFDEAANIGWAKRLEQAGVHVAYGLVGLKIHSKVLMVVREEAEGIRRYCHLGTGNYNHRTARTYEDLGLLTADPVVGADIALLFNYLTGYGRDIHYERLLVAPERLRRGLYSLIEAEAASGRGRIIMKMNALVDAEMIDRLYAAAAAGVEIDLVVRGICCLRPGVSGLSERIRVRSIVGRYLEHSRIYHFANGAGEGRAVTLIGSADLMTRNLDRRVEALVRVDDDALVARLLEILEVELTDDRLAWTLDGDGVWTRRRGPAGIDTHERLQNLARARAAT
ncbi:MAG: RNA degradosome polyphosphate kinase [Actinomyces sp.]|nr:MAG: RNA degradosome polyphosphate kinase [Actinomyces sp.]